jgi:hypothetical protein
MKQLICYAIFITTIVSSSSIYTSMLHEEIPTDIAIYRLEKHIIALEQFNVKNKMLKLIPQKLDIRFVFVDDFLEITHDLLRICVKKMINEQSIDPLFVAWRLFVTEYRNIDTETFLREMGHLVFSVYKNTFVMYLNNKVSIPHNSVNWQVLHHMVTLYEHVASLPLRQLLDNLDRCLEQFFEIIRNLVVEEEASLFSWLKKYWWVPPIVITSLVINFFGGFLHFRTQHDQGFFLV